jgi:hypothetical protein
MIVTLLALLDVALSHLMSMGISGLEWNLALPRIVTKVGRDSVEPTNAPGRPLKRGNSVRGFG